MQEHRLLEPLRLPQRRHRHVLLVVAFGRSLELRPSYDMPLDLRLAHQFNADLHLLDWLEEKRLPRDVITDHDLHDEGVELLRPLPRRPDRQPPGVLDRADARRAAGLPRDRRPADVPRRQRLLLGDVDPPRRAARDRGPPRPRGHAAVELAAGRGLPRRHRRARRPVALPRPPAAAARRRRLHRAGLRTPAARTGACPGSFDPRAALDLRRRRRRRADRRLRARDGRRRRRSRSTASTRRSARRRTRSLLATRRRLHRHYQASQRTTACSTTDRGRHGRARSCAPTWSSSRRRAAARSSPPARSRGAAASRMRATRTTSPASWRTSCAGSSTQRRSRCRRDRACDRVRPVRVRDAGRPLPGLPAPAGAGTRLPKRGSRLLRALALRGRAVRIPRLANLLERRRRHRRRAARADGAVVPDDGPAEARPAACRRPRAVPPSRPGRTGGARARPHAGAARPASRASSTSWRRSPGACRFASSASFSGSRSQTS